MEHLEEQSPKDIIHEQATLVVTEEIRSYIYETAKWARFLSIVGFVITGWLIIVAFSTSAFETAFQQTIISVQLAELGSTVLMIFFLLTALVYFYPSLMLFKYATAAKTAVLYGVQESLEIAMAKMKSFFKFWAILTIVMLAFYAIAMLAVVVANIGAPV